MTAPPPLKNMARDSGTDGHAVEIRSDASRPRACRGVTGARGLPHVQSHRQPRQRRARLYRWPAMGERRLVEPEAFGLRHPGQRRAGRAILLCLRDGRARRRVERQGLHVHQRPRVQDRRTSGLLRARLRAHRIFSRWTPARTPRTGRCSLPIPPTRDAEREDALQPPFPSRRNALVQTPPPHQDHRHPRARFGRSRSQSPICSTPAPTYSAST